jgi:hypothetical protein
VGVAWRHKARRKEGAETRETMEGGKKWENREGKRK